MPLSAPPIEPLIPEIIQALTRHPVVILQAPPGAGKTTRVPLALLNAEGFQEGKILILEPRRLAASNAARYMSAQFGEPVGRRVGYSIRYQRKISPETRIEVVTEGILSRRLQNDPELNGVSLVIFDEFHERHLQSDLALALCLDVQRSLRNDLKLLIMSATLDSGPLAERLQAPVLTSSGQSYPVTMHHLSETEPRQMVTKTVAAIHRALAETEGDLLVFLPGEGEIRRCRQQLANLPASLMVCPLYGNLPFSAQQQAIQPATKRKIVLATNIAETSLTIEGTRTVIDSGYSRQPRFDAGSGLTRLQLGRISQASATQRAGRAGRLGPGHCYRLWSEGGHQTLLPFTPAEIRTGDLSSLVLELLAWGIQEPEQLFWLDPPSPSAWQAGTELLDLLGALSKQRQLNKTGQKLAKLPAHPRLGRLLITAQENNLLPLGCDLAALLNEPWPRLDRPAAGKSDSDILDRLEAYHRRPESPEFSALARASRYWQSSFKLPKQTSPPKATSQQLAQLLAAAYPDRIGKVRQPGSDRYLLSSGQGVITTDKSSVKSEYLIAVEIRPGRNDEAEICLANSIDKASLASLFPALPWQKLCYWEQSEGRVISCERQMLGALILNQRTGKACQENIQQAVIDKLQTEGGLQLLNWTARVKTFRNRVLFLHNNLPEQSWPDFSDQALSESLHEWLQPYLGDARSKGDLLKIDLLAALGSRLDWQQRQQLDRLAPERIKVPSGSMIRVDYQTDENPILSVKLQEMFGQTETPRVADGQVAVTVHLLSPAGRPLQITQDLRHFWQTSYPEVKKEMKGRYPKHPWPDDPLSALATAKTKRKLAQQESKK